jgi:hypothetical protein
MRITTHVHKYRAEQALSEEEANAQDMSENSRDFVEIGANA